MIQSVSTEKAPAAIGPYSQACVIPAHASVVYCSGQIPIEPSTGQVIEAGIEEQTRLVLSNLRQVLLAAHSDLNLVAKTTVLLKDMNDFAKMNAIYAEFFGSHRPARAAFQVARLPRDVLVEIECVAIQKTHLESQL